VASRVVRQADTIHFTRHVNVGEKHPHVLPARFQVRDRLGRVSSLDHLETLIDKGGDDPHAD
jgi:hypothetical protein